jgi:hypothetical protein
MPEPVRLSIGLHDGIAAADYHADPGESPTLSSHIAAKLLRSTPLHAWTCHPRLNPAFAPEQSTKFSRGSVAHELALGRGNGFVVVDAPAWTTKAAREERDQAFAEGRTPILAAQYEEAHTIARAIWKRLGEITETADLVVDGVLAPHAKTERVLIWNDPGGVLCRSMLDLADLDYGEIYDIKTTDNPLGDEPLARLIDSLNYDLAAAFYIRGTASIFPSLEGRIKWRWIFAETCEPFEVRLIEADNAMIALGDRKAALAIEKWRKCIESNVWPGYPAKVTRLAPSKWAINSVIEREIVDPDALDMVPLALKAAAGDLDSIMPV